MVGEAMGGQWAYGTSTQFSCECKTALKISSLFYKRGKRAAEDGERDQEPRNAGRAEGPTHLWGETSWCYPVSPGELLSTDVRS